MAKAAIAGGRRRAGFTLIELLVAITVLAVVAVLGWRGLDGIVRARLALNEQLTQTRGMQLAFAQLQSDCANLAAAALIPNRAALVADDNLLLLVRTVYADDQPSRLQVVAYRLRDGVLTRQESAPTRTLTELDALWQAAMDGKGATPAVALQPGLAAMTIRLWAAD
ncbi:MAG: prepilin-type N-terminal cleavage/methylation domain-containing protein, partial [Burkholderiaceae bacterium]